MTGSHRPLVALVSATLAAVKPAEEALARIFPDATAWNILDDRLLVEADRRGGLDEQLRDRMIRLINHALTERASAVLLTCSMYAPVAHAYPKTEVPVLAPDDAAFDCIADLAQHRVLVVGSLPTPLADSCERLENELVARGLDVVVSGVVAAGAFDAALAGDAQRLFEAIARTVDAVDIDDAPIFLAQYSLAPAATLLAKRGLQVVSGPDAAAGMLRGRLGGVP